MASTLPNASFKDIVGGKSIVSLHLSALAATSPYKILVRASPLSTLPQEVRHTIAFQIQDATTRATLVSVTKNLAELSTDPISLSYTPATTADRDLLNAVAQSGTATIPAYLLAVVPELKLGSQVLAAGPPIGLGQSQILEMILTAPDSGPMHISNTMIAGSYNVIVVNLSQFSDGVFDALTARARNVRASLASGVPPTKEDVLGQLLTTAGASYWSHVDFLNRILAQTSKVVIGRLPSEGIYSLQLAVRFLFSVPFTATASGFVTDIDHNVQIVGPKDGSQDRQRNYLIASGMYSSRLEASIYDLLMNRQPTNGGVSTAHILEFASRNGIPIFEITQANINTVLPLLNVSLPVRFDVINAIAAGKTVTIPQREVQIGGFRGSGYLVLDPVTGGGAYLISGGFAGGGFSVSDILTDPLFALARFTGVCGRTCAAVR